jgi:hypothetical protein
MEARPGEEVQVDFGLGAPISEGTARPRRSWVFRMVLSYSRKAYSEAILRQDTETFLRCLENGLREFGGVSLCINGEIERRGVAREQWRSFPGRKRSVTPEASSEQLRAWSQFFADKHRHWQNMRWSHTRHHTETIQIGLDPEIQVMRPANLTNVVLDFLWLPGAFAMLKTMTLHALGILTKEARDFVPESEQRPMMWWSRLYMMIYLGMAAWSIAARSWLPVLFFPLGHM